MYMVDGTVFVFFCVYSLFITCRAGMVTYGGRDYETYVLLNNIHLRIFFFCRSTIQRVPI